MKQQHVRLSTRLALAAIALIGLLMAITATNTSASGDWLEVFVGFVMLLAIGLGSLWFTQHQMKIR